MQDCFGYHISIQLASILSQASYYKMYHWVQVDVGQRINNQILNLDVPQKECGKKDTRWLAFPRIIFGILRSQHQLKKKPKEKKDARLGEEYLSKKEAELEVDEKAEREAEHKS